MIHVGDVGTVIRITLSDDTDISGASEVRIRYRKPSGTTSYWTASVVSNGVQYTTETGDIDESGTWQLQAWIDLSESFSGSTTVATMRVGRNLT
jgi:hypothetical protein